MSHPPFDKTPFTLSLHSIRPAWLVTSTLLYHFGTTIIITVCQLEAASLLASTLPLLSMRDIGIDTIAVKYLLLTWLRSVLLYIVLVGHKINITNMQL